MKSLIPAIVAVASVAFVTTFFKEVRRRVGEFVKKYFWWVLIVSVILSYWEKILFYLNLYKVWILVGFFALVIIFGSLYSILRRSAESDNID